MALEWTNKTNGVDNVDANDVNTLAKAITEDETDLATHKSAVVLQHPDKSVTTAKIADRAVTADKINDKAVTKDKINEGAVITAKIADKSITTDKLTDNSVTETKLDTTLSGKINSKANSSDVYTKTEIDTKLGQKADKATTLSGYGIADAYTKSETDTKLDAKANADDVYTKTQTDTKLETKENVANKVTEISDTSTNEQYPSAKAVNDTVKAAKTSANNNFANALKGSASGENAVRIDDSSPIEHEMSVRVSSKNLIDGSLWKNSATANGVTVMYSKEEDCFILNGTATANTTMASKPLNIYAKNKTTIFSTKYVSGTVNVPTGEHAVFYLGKGDSPTGTVANYRSTSDFKEEDTVGTPSTLTDYDYINRAWFYITSGVSFDNYKIRIQLEFGDEVTEYTPYISDLSSVTASKYGKNLLPYPYAETTKTVKGVTFTDNGDGSITVSGTATGYASFAISSVLSSLPLTVVPGATYTFSSLAVSAGNIAYSIAETNNQETITTHICEPNKNLTFTVSKNTNALSIVIKRKNDGIECKGTFYHHMLELGATATEYESYVEPTVYTPQADGKVNGVKNIYPTTTLLSDTGGVVIEVEYNRDINKAFEELKNAILSQGGNV